MVPQALGYLKGKGKKAQCTCGQEGQVVPVWRSASASHGTSIPQSTWMHKCTMWVGRVCTLLLWCCYLLMHMSHDVAGPQQPESRNRTMHMWAGGSEICKAYMLQRRWQLPKIWIPTSFIVIPPAVGLHSNEHFVHPTALYTGSRRRFVAASSSSSGGAAGHSPPRAVRGCYISRLAGPEP
jgi:hypothetical protein